MDWCGSSFEGPGMSAFFVLNIGKLTFYCPVKRVPEHLGLSSPNVDIYRSLSYPSYPICGRRNTEHFHGFVGLVSVVVNVHK